MQKQRKLEPVQTIGQKSVVSNGSCQASLARIDPFSNEKTEATLERVLASENMQRAWKQVRRNKGAAGVDGLTISSAHPWLHQHWESVKSDVLSGRYVPQPVKRVDIPKPDGSLRMLGVPTVVDRLLQQAVAQALTPVFDPFFSESSFGFRPRRSAHQAIQAAKKYISSGLSWVVDLDLSKFFDRVNHDILMSLVARKVQDKRLLKLIRSWLECGMMSEGVVHDRTEGTPQGGPLSPLLANIILDELDKRLEEAGHSFCRYADDCNVYLRSEQAGKRVMLWMRNFLESKLKLKVNEAKSAVSRPEARKFLGFSFYRGKRKVKVRVAETSWQRFKQRVRILTARRQGCSLEDMIARLNRYLQGWRGYYRISEIPPEMHKADSWIRRRLRCFLLRQWKRPKTRASKLHQLGGRESWTIISSKGLWRLSQTKATNSGLKNAFFKEKGLVSLGDAYA